jgi:hypothetical protein
MTDVPMTIFVELLNLQARNSGFALFFCSGQGKPLAWQGLYHAAQFER